MFSEENQLFRIWEVMNEHFQYVICVAWKDEEKQQQQQQPTNLSCQLCCMYQPTFACVCVRANACVCICTPISSLKTHIRLQFGAPLRLADLERKFVALAFIYRLFIDKFESDFAFLTAFQAKTIQLQLNMIIYSNKGNPYGLRVRICVQASGSNIKFEEFTSEGMCVCVRLTQILIYPQQWCSCSEIAKIYRHFSFINEQ